MKTEQDGRMGRMTEVQTLPFEQLTGSILESAFTVAHELGHGFLESIYQKAMVIALADKGHRVETERPFAVRFRDQVIGEYCADLIVDGTVILELKAVKALLPEHQAQTITYLKASGLPVGLLINFGTPRLEYKRCHA
jgi:GxxExxY protein